MCWWNPLQYIILSWIILWSKVLVTFCYLLYIICKMSNHLVHYDLNIDNFVEATHKICFNEIGYMHDYKKVGFTKTVHSQSSLHGLGWNFVWWIADNISSKDICNIFTTYAYGKALLKRSLRWVRGIGLLSAWPLKRGST